MSATEFFRALARLLQSNPPPAADAPILAQLARIGIVAGERFDPEALDPAIARGLSQSLTAALTSLQAEAESKDATVNGWRIPPMALGNYGADFGLRALIALIAFGANLPADGIYPTTFADEEGQPLSGVHKYRLRFEKGQAPPVDAFWSVTMYGPQSFFVDNPANRYAISSWMPLVEEADGSIVIQIQHNTPDPAKVPNWLPAPDGAFNLTLRMYWPKRQPPSILDGSWIPPGVTRA
jgi:hypothetical protein